MSSTTSFGSFGGTRGVWSKVTAVYGARACGPDTSGDRRITAGFALAASSSWFSPVQQLLTLGVCGGPHKVLRRESPAWQARAS